MIPVGRGAIGIESAGYEAIVAVKVRKTAVDSRAEVERLSAERRVDNSDDTFS